MFQRVMVPLDGSRFSELAVPTAVGLARRLGGEVHLVTVAHPTPGSGLGAVAETGLGSEEARSAATREAERYLDEARRRMTPEADGVEITTRVIPAGEVVPSLLNEAERREADLVVMTTHGRGGIQRAWFGSVAEGLVRRSSRPVLLVRPVRGEEGEEEPDPLSREAGPFRHILVPLDGSQAAEGALEPARRLAERDEARITLVHVLPPVIGGAYPYLTVPVRKEEDPEETGREAAHQELAPLADELRAGGVPTEVEVEVSNHPALEILRRVRESDVDLVVMTTRGHGAAGRLLLGSVADKVVRGSEVPVLLRRPQPESAEEGGPPA